MNYAVALAYILKVPLAVIALYVALRLLMVSFKSLKRAFGRQSGYVEGYFLLQSNSASDMVQTHKLCRTNIIGKMRSADLRFKNSKLCRNHATLYFFQGKWWIVPTAKGNTALLNGIAISHRHELCNQDQLTLGDIDFTFVDELALSRSGAEYYADDYDYMLPDNTSPIELKQRQSKPQSLKFAWFLQSCFYLVAVSVVYFSLSDQMLSRDKQIVMILLAGIFGAIHITRFIWKQMISPTQDDSVLLLGLFYLLTIGCLIQTRLSLFGFDVPSKWQENQATFYHLLTIGLAKQLVFLLVGVIVLPFLVAWFSRSRFLETVAPLCLVITPLIYITTLVIGRGASEHGASLWIKMPFGLQIQLTEFAKIAYLLVVALFFKIRPAFKQQLYFALWAAFQFFLIVLLPDLGSAMILLPVTLIVFFVMTSEYLKTSLILLGGVGAGAVAYQLLPYVQRRFHGWITLWEGVNPQNSQIVYGLQAFTRGGLFGRGIGLGTPDAIPVIESDMVFAAVAEELGLLVGIGIVLVFFAIWLKSVVGTIKAIDGFRASLLLGAASLLLIEALLVIGGSTGLLPLTGVTLPFISYGGSSVLAKYGLFAIIIAMTYFQSDCATVEAYH